MKPVSENQKYLPINELNTIKLGKKYRHFKGKEAKNLVSCL